MKTVFAIEDKVVAEILKKDFITSGGLFIPDSAEKEPQTYGLVISVGAKVTTIKAGDTIICAKHGGQAFIINDKIMKCYMLAEIFAVVREEEVVN